MNSEGEFVPRTRNIKPDSFQDPELGDLSPLHRWCLQGLKCHADREGRLWDKPRELKVKVLPFDNCDMNEVLEDLHRAGFIIRYEVQGIRYIQIQHFEEEQRFHKDEKPLGLPVPPPLSGVGTTSAPPKQTAEVGSAALVSCSLYLESRSNPLTPTQPEATEAPAAPVGIQENLLEVQQPPEEIENEKVSRVMAYFLEAMHANKVRCRETPKGRQMIRARIKEGFAVDDLFEAVNGLTRSAFHREKGLFTLKYCMRNAEQVEMISQRQSTVRKRGFG